MNDKTVRVDLFESSFEQAIHAIEMVSEALSFYVLDHKPMNEKERNEFFDNGAYDITMGAMRAIYALSDFASQGMANEQIKITG